MFPKYKFILFLFSLISLGSCSDSSTEENNKFELLQIFLDNSSIDFTNNSLIEIPVNLRMELIFSTPVEISSLQQGITLSKTGQIVELNFQSSNAGANIVLSSKKALDFNSEYKLILSDELKSVTGSSVTPVGFNLKTIRGTVSISSLIIDEWVSTPFNNILNVDLRPVISIDFNHDIDLNQLKQHTKITGPKPSSFQINHGDALNKIIINVNENLESWSEYFLSITSAEIGQNQEIFAGTEKNFFTTIDSSQKFPSISTEELLQKVQRTTFKYFWDLAHPNSGLARERNSSNDLVTSGGSGFGLMAIIVGIENGFVTRPEGITRIEKIVDFLENADRFHGVWSHWLNGNTGKVIPFSPNDNGGDLVETSFLVQGLITVRQFLDKDDARELAIINKINTLWNEIEWDWYTKGGENVLYWHWSPDFNWAINLKIRGHNETLITYVLAASSPTHPISSAAYHQGYARAGNMVNGKEFYNYLLPLGSDYGGPLFFAHYSFLGLDPRELKDQYANYWLQNKNHTLINREWCIRNTNNYVGYSQDCWGLTASDNHEGYSAHSPNNDRGVITPTAAISSLPYTPDESLKALEFFYYVLGDRIWGEYGFYDSFNATENWYARSYLAIDQGPIICMIENYKSGLLWNLFMSAPEIQTGLEKLGFTY